MPTEHGVHDAPTTPSYDASAKQKAQAKTARIPIKVIPAEPLRKPDEWQTFAEFFAFLLDEEEPDR